ncbi:inorganic diphosphatase [Texas Phoenix palm phytoplasma]|uniref:Inorganic pyrophosphatase n=1 Tax=Texas Phoenix palm phytoplasma TaxID=176709 RepID=A0ABS5BIE3_9MOLU|nr:inorganic diphosphatase [Texas Phoenix palm phytoplasma]MBP3059353.1 inorganic diphosphatase [Texas Phoenix palm phytoplasma]
MNLLKNLSLNRINKKKFIVFIEIPEGSKKKYELDKETGFLILDRFLTTSFRYPANYGFIPFTYCEDKDPLDVFVLSQEVLDPMVLVECRAIGVIKMIDNGELDEKIIAVPIADLSTANYNDMEDIPSYCISEIKHFLSHYKDLENKKVLIKKIDSKNEAELTIENSLLKYKELKSHS